MAFAEGDTPPVWATGTGPREKFTVYSSEAAAAADKTEAAEKVKLGGEELHKNWGRMLREALSGFWKR